MNSPVWDGRGLPPAAAARMQRFASSPVASSLLSVPSEVSLETVGFDAVGEAMGCAVVHLGWTGWGGCGYYGGAFGSWQSQFAVQGSTSFAGFGPYRDAVENGYTLAMRRLCAEAQAMGADGVVGVRLTQQYGHIGDNHEFLAIGTAVRGRSDVRSPYPFTTELSGTDTAKLLIAGWTPVQIRLGIEVAIRHDDYQTQWVAGGGLFNSIGNAEVPGYTHLVQYTRAAARHRLEQAIHQTGAEGLVVHDMGLRIWEIEPTDGHTDHVAEAMIRGTAIAKFVKHTRIPTDTLTMLPLRNRKRFSLDGE